MNKESSFVEILKKEGRLIYPFKGISMLPLLYEDSDQVKIEPSNEYHKYDVVLYIRNNQYVLHRIFKIKRNVYYIVGDNSYQVDKVLKEDILGKMVGYYHNDTYIDINDKTYIDYLNKYIINKDPLKKKLIDPYNTSRNYELNDNIIKAYRALFVYSVIPSLFKVDDIKNLSKKDFYNFYLLTVYKKSDHVLSEIINKYQLDIDESILVKLNKITNIIKNRYIYQDYYKSEISNLFKEHQIKHMYFRGNELRDRFTNPYLRMSNDIDIYVDKSDLQKAENLLINKYHPRTFTTHTVHHTFNLPNGRIQVELHYALLESYLERVNLIIGDPFTRATSDKDNPYLYHMDDKYYYLYHLAHFAKHLKEGEYWLSMLQDSYLYMDIKADELLDIANFSLFKESVNHLLKYYLGETNQYDSRIRDLEKIMYKDSFSNYVLINKNKYKNKFIYILRRIFLTPQELVTSYPSMRGRVYLYPYYFFKRLFSKKKNKPHNELKVYKELKNDNLKNIYNNIGILF